MYKQKSRNSGSAVRRSLMALVITATPLAAIASVSGVAQAGSIDEVTAEIVCGKDGAYVDVEIDNRIAGGEFYSVWVGNELVLDGKSPGHINSKKIAEGLAEGPVYVEVRLTEGDVLVEEFYLTVDCYNVSVSCANRTNPTVTVTTPDDESDDYTVYLYNSEDEEVDYSGEVEIPANTEVVLESGGQGIFTVVINPTSGPNIEFTVDVDCPRRIPWLPSATTAPVLPSTGSESNTLLVIAPMLVLLGGGLIVARRRLANA